MTLPDPSRLAVDGRRSTSRSDADWDARLASDVERAMRNQSREQQRITDEVLRRSVAAGARAVALTGSTARNRRTTISDLDYHVVGPRPDVTDLPAEVDVYACSEERLWERLEDGDDFIQWTLRCGCILFDTGVMRSALERVTTGSVWPDADAKLARLPELARLGARLIAMGDRDAAQDQVRAALTAAARGLLLREHVFPLSRSELAAQLRSIGRTDLGRILDRTIYETLPLEQLDAALASLRLELAEPEGGRVTLRRHAGVYPR